MMPHFTVQQQTSMFMDSLRSIERLYDEYAKSVGLTYLSLGVLTMLYETPKGCTQKAICEKTHLPKQSVNVIIRSFWEKGYVEMREQDSDRRNKTILLSASGKKYAKRIVGKLTQVEDEVISQLSYEQRQELIDLVRKLQAGLENSLKTPEGTV